MSSMIFIVPIVLLALYSAYRYVKRDMLGERGGGCSNCPSRKQCDMNESMKKTHS